MICDTGEPPRNKGNPMGIITKVWKIDWDMLILAWFRKRKNNPK